MIFMSRSVKPIELAPLDGVDGVVSFSFTIVVECDSEIVA